MGMAGSNHRKPKAHSEPSSPSPAMLEFTIDSNNDASRKVQIAVLAELSKRGFDTNAAYAIRLALEEGMQNAIRHGNRLNPKKKVHILATDKILKPPKLSSKIRAWGSTDPRFLIQRSMRIWKSAAGGEFCLLSDT